jgi:DMSO/TMAO reductase YedYZ molybdopterin-dependent catalytic subunit
MFGLPMLAISIAIGGSTVNSALVALWLAVVFLVWGSALNLAYLRLVPVKRDEIIVMDEARSVETVDRRQFLIRLGAATATITVLGTGVGEVLARAARRDLDEEIESTMAHQSQGSPKSLFPNSGDPVVPAPGTRPEYTPVKDHYEVFLRVKPTVIDGNNYTLPITGSIDNTMMLTLDDIRNNYESMDHYVTLSCISGRLGTDLISTTQWTGVSMQKILADAKVRSSARFLFIRSGDGFYETVPLEEIAEDERIMLTYAWDGNNLPVNHGFPLRIWRPDRYGMKQPKWITSMELIDEFKPGYWVERGWSGLARVQTVSVVDTVALDAIIQDGDRRLVPVGGIAFAGARGISKVEVSVDGGPWEQAKLRAPLSDTTWVIWRFDWPFQEGEHTFAVRAAERDGTPQVEVSRPNRPSGATGIHSLRAG